MYNISKINLIDSIVVIQRWMQWLLSILEEYKQSCHLKLKFATENLNAAVSFLLFFIRNSIFPTTI